MDTGTRVTLLHLPLIWNASLRMKILNTVAACLTILCGGSVCRQRQVTIKKCCPELEILDTSHKCVENLNDTNNTLLHEVGKKKNAEEVNIVSNITGIQCETGHDYIAAVKAVLTDESLVLDLLNHRVEITQKYSCLDQIQDQEGFVAVVCHEDIPTKKGFVNKCCPFGQAVAMDTKECQDGQEVEDEKMFLSDLIVRSRWSELTTKVVEVKILEFENLCESGEALPVVVSGITSDGFMITDTKEIGYGCVDTDKGDIVAWICSGKLTCPSKSCIEKCCKQDEVLDEYANCLKPEHQKLLWSPKDLDIFNGAYQDVMIRNSFLTDFIDNHPRLSYCEIYFLEPGFDVYKITENGSLNHVDHELTMDYCIDNVRVNGSMVTKVVRCALRLDGPICNITDECYYTNHITLYPEQDGVLGLICLTFTCFVYWTIPGFQTQ